MSRGLYPRNVHSGRSERGLTGGRWYEETRPRGLRSLGTQRGVDGVGRVSSPGAPSSSSVPLPTGFRDPGWVGGVTCGRSVERDRVFDEEYWRH